MYGRVNPLPSLILGLVLAALFIWSVNTLFGVGIPFTFKTYAASFIFLMCVRFFTSKTTYTTDPWLDELFDGGMDEDEDDDNGGSDDYEPEPPSSPSGKHLKRVK